RHFTPRVTIFGVALRIQAMQKSPEQWLEEVAPAKSQGILKLFLGYAPGVGKTYSMLSEAIRRASRGEEVLVGVVETHGRKATAELAAKLEAVPRRKLEYKGTVFEEMDVDAILARKPSVVVVDELAHTNIEGSKHLKRYEDVMELLDHNIDVLSTMNVQHVESLGPTILQITGVQVRETVPDWVMQRVDEIVLADVTPQALQKRMQRGDIYPVERAGRALAHFFRPGNLIALRELALRQVTQVVDRSLDAFLEKEDIPEPSSVRERILVCISSNPAAQYLIARGSRMAQGMKGELYVCYVDTGRQFGPEDQKTLTENIRFAENLGAKVAKIKGKTVAEAAAEFVREKHITQIIFGRSARSGWQRFLYLRAIQHFLQSAPSVDVHIVTQEDR
ncbi:MAG: universal stress protein, partial [Candidatus Korobacteraceae bacterium]